MKEAAFTVDSNFPVKGLGLAGIPQPSNLDRSKFVSESSLDTAIATIHKAADLPYLTMNDKVFAARYTVAGLTATVTSAPVPDDTWTTADILVWLVNNGVTVEDDVLTKSELLELVEDVLDTP